MTPERLAEILVNMERKQKEGADYARVDWEEFRAIVKLAQASAAPQQAQGARELLATIEREREETANRLDQLFRQRHTHADIVAELMVFLNRCAPPPPSRSQEQQAEGMRCQDVPCVKHLIPHCERCWPPSRSQEAERGTADAWLIERADGSREVVLSPLTDATFMDEGDQAWPLYKAAPPTGQAQAEDKP